MIHPNNFKEQFFSKKFLLVYFLFENNIYINDLITKNFMKSSSSKRFILCFINDKLYKQFTYKSCQFSITKISNSVNILP